MLFRLSIMMICKELIHFCYIWMSEEMVVFFFSSRRRHTRFSRDWSSDVCSSDLDLKYCKAYISVLGNEEAQKSTMEGLKNAKPYIRDRKSVV